MAQTQEPTGFEHESPHNQAILNARARDGQAPVSPAGAGVGAAPAEYETVAHSSQGGAAEYATVARTHHDGVASDRPLTAAVPTSAPLPPGAGVYADTAAVDEAGLGAVRYRLQTQGLEQDEYVALRRGMDAGRAGAETLGRVLMAVVVAGVLALLVAVAVSAMGVTATLTLASASTGGESVLRLPEIAVILAGVLLVGMLVAAALAQGARTRLLRASYKGAQGLKRERLLVLGDDALLVRGPHSVSRHDWRGVQGLRGRRDPYLLLDDGQVVWLPRAALDAQGDRKGFLKFVKDRVRG